MQRHFILAIISIIFFASCSDSRITDQDSWGKIFEKYQVKGGFEILDNNKEIVNYYNRLACSKPLPPGQTFYIISSIIGLESSAVLEDNKPILWVSKMNDSLDKNGTIRTFYKENNTAFFNQLAKEISPLKMKEYLDTIKYGNMEVNNESYWQDGTLTISPDEQVGLMKRIYFNQLPFISTRSTTIVKSMMQEENTDEIKLYYQISPVVDSGKNNIWIVGFAENFNPLKNPVSHKIENKVHPFFFTGLIQDVPADFPLQNAKSLMMDILKDYQIIK